MLELLSTLKHIYFVFPSVTWTWVGTTDWMHRLPLNEMFFSLISDLYLWLSPRKHITYYIGWMKVKI